MEIEIINDLRKLRTTKLAVKRLNEFLSQVDNDTVSNQDILLKYKRGFNLSEISLYCGCSRNKAYVLCRGYNNKVCVALPDNIINKVVKLYYRDYPVDTIAKKVKIGITDVNIILAVEGLKGFTSNETILDSSTILEIYILAQQIVIYKGYTNTTDAANIIEAISQYNSITDEDKSKLSVDTIISRMKQMGFYKPDKKYSVRITDEEKERFYKMYTRDNHTIAEIAKYTGHCTDTVSKYIKEYEKEYIKKNFVNLDK